MGEDLYIWWIQDDILPGHVVARDLQDAVSKWQAANTEDGEELRLPSDGCSRIDDQAVII